MRADAEANRGRLLDAAGVVFAEHGVDAPMNLVAEQAHVGIGTLYRHFADRDALILGLVERMRGRYRSILRGATSAESGWEGIVMYLDSVASSVIEQPWIGPVQARALSLRLSDDAFERDVKILVERAQAEGTLRPDSDATDLAFAPAMLGGLAQVPEPTRSVVMARQCDIILYGLRYSGVSSVV
jgi:AcrR family transcriptional regulator